jgi:ribonuclease D
MTAPLVTRLRDLEALAARLRGEGVFALDTEFERERSFWPKLQLIQVAGADFAAVVDPLSLDRLTPLYDLLLDPSLVIVVHAGRQDAEIFFNRMGAPPANFYDTQIAAAFLGHGDQVGYAALVNRILGVRLKKTERVTDWGTRPLSTAQIEYALADVRYLLEIKTRLDRELESRGRRGWLAEELARYADSRNYGQDEETLWLRVAGWRGLDRRGLAILQELARWREEEAQTRDVPRQRVIPDDVLVDIAARAPRALADLSPLRRLPPRELDRSGLDLLKAVKTGVALPEERLPSPLPPAREDPDAALIADLLNVLLRRRARDTEIAPSLLGNRQGVEDLVARLGEPQSGSVPSLLVGWRRELVGAELARLWEGKTALRIEGDPRKVVARAWDGDSG